MTLLELNSMLMGKNLPDDNKKRNNYRVTEEDFVKFKELLLINDKLTSYLDGTDNYKDFYNACKFIGDIIPKEKQEELFYAAKLGFFYHGVPTKLTYILKLALKKYDTPNVAISAIDKRLWQKYLIKGVMPENTTIKDVIENLLNKPIELLTKSTLKVVNNGLLEVYVANKDRVLVLPTEFGSEMESLNDLKSVEYVKDVGVCVQGIPIRTLKGRVGITLNEYDLRNVI